MATYEIALIPAPQKFTVTINNVIYNFRLRYCNTPMGGWILDISDQNDIPIVCGIPLITGADLIGQYSYLGIFGSAFVQTDGAPPVTPTHDNLGVGSHLYWEL